MAGKGRAVAGRADHGDLQRAILAIVWRRERCTVREVHEELSTSRKIAYTTVLTVMTRLAERGQLRREVRGNRGVFSPVRSKDTKAAGQLVDQLLGRFGSVAVAAFVARTKDQPDLYRELLESLEVEDD
jgi:predicted transcriptional regulator